MTMSTLSNFVQGEYRTKARETLSDLVIPAVPGEYYSYSSEFTKDRPLYALLKCKANKNRPISALRNLGREANLLFSFGAPQVCSVQEARDSGLLPGVAYRKSLVETWITP